MMLMDMEVVMYIHHTQGSSNNAGWMVWAKRLGWLAVLVVLIKGVVWATLPLLMMFIGIGV